MTDKDLTTANEVLEWAFHSKNAALSTTEIPVLTDTAERLALAMRVLAIVEREAALGYPDSSYVLRQAKGNDP